MSHDTYNDEQIDRVKRIPSSAPPVTSRTLPSSVKKEAPIKRTVTGGEAKGKAKK